MSHLTRCAYVSGPYWSVRDRWQIVHVSDTYDTGKMKIKCNLYVTTRNIYSKSGIMLYIKRHSESTGRKFGFFWSRNESPIV